MQETHTTPLVFPVGISGMITLPVSAQMYQSLVQQQINDNTVCVTPMQVQNFISNNSLCGSIANSNLNASTTYIMANNRNVIGMPYTAPNGSLKTLMTGTPNIYSPKSRTVVKKTYGKRKVFNLAMAKPKASSTSSAGEPRRKPSNNNNSTNAKNRNKAKSPVKPENPLTSQINADFSTTKKESSLEVPKESKIKDEDTASVDV